MKFRFGVFNIVFLMLLTISTSYAQQYPAANQVKYPMNLYSGADTKGVLVIGSGAPSFTPKAKQSRVYVDSVAGTIYCRKNGSWEMLVDSSSFANTNYRLTGARNHSGSGYDLKLDSIARFTVNSVTYNNFSSPSNQFTGAQFKVVGGNIDVDIPSRASKPEGTFLHKTAGDTLIYSDFGFKPGTPADKSIMYFDLASKQYKAIGIFVSLLGATEYANDAAAGAGGVGIGEYYVLSSGNTYSLQQGVVKKRIL